jgi:hypothetical protein
MLLRIENSFLQLANKLGKSFSEEDKEKLARFPDKKILKNNLNRQLLNWETLGRDL